MKTSSGGIVRGRSKAASWCRALAGMPAMLVLAACGGSGIGDAEDCKRAIAATVAEFGQPDDVATKELGDARFRLVYTYRSRQLVRTFEWGVFDDCTVDDRPLVEPAAAPSRSVR